MSVFVRRSLGMALVVACSLSTAPLAEEFDPEGDPIPQYEGAFFGFVKDTNGGSVPDATVTLAAKGRDAVVVRTNAMGIYRVSLGKEVAANDVVVSCTKAGFKQVRVARRTALDASVATPIEVECTLTADGAR